MTTQMFSVWSALDGKQHRVTLLQPDPGSSDLGVTPAGAPGVSTLTLDDGRVLRTLGDGRYQDASSDEQFSTSPPSDD